MWLSRQKTKDEKETAEVGTVSIGGASAAVMAGCEYRAAALFGPSGLAWAPRVGASALIIKTGDGQAVAGTSGEDKGLLPGEIMLYSDGCALKLAVDGGIYMTGNVYVNGVQLGGGDGA